MATRMAEFSKRTNQSVEEDADPVPMALSSPLLLHSDAAPYAPSAPPSHIDAPRSGPVGSTPFITNAGTSAAYASYNHMPMLKGAVWLAAERGDAAALRVALGPKTPAFLCCSATGGGSTEEAEEEVRM